MTHPAVDEAGLEAKTPPAFGELRKLCPVPVAARSLENLLPFGELREVLQWRPRGGHRRPIAWSITLPPGGKLVFVASEAPKRFARRAWLAVHGRMPKGFHADHAFAQQAAVINKYPVVLVALSIASVNSRMGSIVEKTYLDRSAEGADVLYAGIYQYVKWSGVDLLAKLGSKYAPRDASQLTVEYLLPRIGRALGLDTDTGLPDDELDSAA